MALALYSGVKKSARCAHLYWRNGNNKKEQVKNQSKNLLSESYKALLQSAVCYVSPSSLTGSLHSAMASAFPSTSTLDQFSSPRAQTPVSSWTRTLQFGVFSPPGWLTWLTVQEALTYRKISLLLPTGQCIRTQGDNGTFSKAWGLGSAVTLEGVTHKNKVLDCGPSVPTPLLAFHLQRKAGLPGPAAPAHFCSSSPDV